ncbi:MAG: hypothetical protein IKP43_11600 [Bacteroidaceae bacterium]|nr:hypothetical protein [Bacteroidaceae bacterium]
MKRILFIASVLLLPLCMAAQTFSAPHLEKATKALKLGSAELRPDTLPSVKTLTKGDKEIVVRFSSKGEIEHIGIPLFSQEIRLLQPSPVYDFLEYATLDRLFKVNDNTLKLDEVKFTKGNWNQLPGILGRSDGCSIINLDDQSYQVEWLKDGQNVLAMQFPINYELLANSEREEMEKRFVKELKAYTYEGKGAADVDATNLIRTDDPDVFVQKGQTYIIAAINNNRYVTISSETDTTVTDTVAHEVLRYRYLFNRHNAAESLSNLMVEPGMKVDGDSISLQVRYYNYKRETLKVSVRDFLGYCIKQGCSPYFGIEEEEGNNITGTLFLANAASGYVHLVNVKCDTDKLFSDRPQLTATMLMFTPTSNIKNLFANIDLKNNLGRKYLK